MPVAWSQPASGTILVEESAATGNRVALYARVSSNDQKADLERQLGRLSSYATANGMSVVRSVAEIGSGLNGHRPKLRRLLPFRSSARSSWSIAIGSRALARNISK